MRFEIGRGFAHSDHPIALEARLPKILQLPVSRCDEPRPIGFDHAFQFMLIVELEHIQAAEIVFTALLANRDKCVVVAGPDALIAGSHELIELRLRFLLIRPFTQLRLSMD